jgi:hypothetical protein
MARDCIAGPDNEFGFVWFFPGNPSGSFHAASWSQTMFVFNRSALAVLVPLALLVGAVLWSNRPQNPQAEAQRNAQAVAANLPSR